MYALVGSHASPCNVECSFSFCCSLMIAVFGLQVVQSNIIYVTPDKEVLCPRNGSQCHTLDWYIQYFNGSFITDNTEVRFLKGVHILSTSVVIQNGHSISIVGVGGAKSSDNGIPHPTSRIRCRAVTSTNTLNSGFVFLNSYGIRFENIALESCGAVVPICNSNISAALFFQHGSDISLQQVVVVNAKGIGLQLDNVFGSILVHESAFFGASRSQRELKLLPGNTKVWFGPNKCGEQCSKSALMEIDSCWFADGQSGANGLEIIARCPNVHVILNNVTVRNNSGSNGGNLAFSVTDFSGVMNSSIIKIRNSHISEGVANMGGGMRIWIRMNNNNYSLDSLCMYNNIHSILDVYNTNFTSNHAKSTGGAVYMSHYQRGGFSCAVKNIAFRHCFFADNFGYGATVEVTKHLILAEHSSPSLHVSFEHCNFHNNSASTSGGYPKGSIMNITRTHVVMSDCTFNGNRGSAIALQESKLNIYNVICFENNIAAYGAALKICEGSFVFLNNNTHVRFINNNASIGGAVFVQQTWLDTTSPCVFQPALHQSISIEEFHNYLKLEFVNNSAETAGDALYGGSFDTCYTIGNYLYNGKQTRTFLHIFNETFTLDGQTGPSRVSSDPRGVCFCEINETSPLHSSLFCQTNHPVINVYPGQKFWVSAIIVGQLNGSSSGVILSSLEEENQFHDLVSHSQGEKISKKCSILTYTLHTNRSRAKILLKPSTTNENQQFSVSFTVNLLPCPLGFQLWQSKGELLYKCHCAELFNQSLGDLAGSVRCDINTLTIRLMEDQWIGCKASSNESVCDLLLVSPSCGEYCVNKDRNVSITNFDVGQCLYNRAGVLCGGCKPGTSHAIGPLPDCEQCSNMQLFIYVPLFLLSGVLFVAILTVLNMTVTEGTINGLIFYTTVMYNYQQFSPNFNNSRLDRLLWTFVSFLNLEPSRAGCAYNGMTGYQFMWIRFGYIFYLLLVQVIIIFLSRRFTFIMRLLGRNVLKVLATLLFLAHSQLLFVCFHTFWLANVFVSTPTPNRTGYIIETVWHFDGNLPYFGIKHTLLFIVALLCSLAVLFFMFSLLFIQCLERWSDRWFLRWIERLRPFFDVYTGPCNETYRFWPGLLYFLRTGLYAFNIYFTSQNLLQLKILISAVCILAMSLGCIFPRGVYKKWILNVLEFSFLLNLCITSIFLGFMNQSKLILHSSVLPVMVTFFGILLYHVHKQMSHIRLWAKVVNWLSARAKNCCNCRYSLPLADDEDALLLPQPFPEFVNVDEYREPLLDGD